MLPKHFLLGTMRSGISEHTQRGQDDDPNPDDVMDRSFVQPRDFHLYEFRNNPGQVYVTTPEAVVRRVFRRARETHRGQGIALNLRVINLGDLEDALNNAEIIGYKLVDVLSNTPIATYDVLGDDIRNNPGDTGRQEQGWRDESCSNPVTAGQRNHISVGLSEQRGDLSQLPRGQLRTWVAGPFKPYNRQLFRVGTSHGALEQVKLDSHTLIPPTHPGS